MFYEEDMCMIYNMKMGRMYERWMGTISLANGDKKCVVISTVTDLVLKKKDIHWDSFVKRALDLPDVENLTKVEGICIDRVHLYLLHEHLICGNLDARITLRNDSSSSRTSCQLSPVSTTEAIRCILGILEGLKVIHSYGFVHPGLSTKKILLTKQGICKLYDFCLVEDTHRTVETKKLQTANNLNNFAPETWMRNEYNHESDIWASAVVIWHIISSGIPPFSVEQTIEKDTRPTVVLPETWPEACLPLRNDVLLECLVLETSSRPTIDRLRQSFIATAERLRSSISARRSTCNLTDLYIPMKEVINKNSEGVSK